MAHNVSLGALALAAEIAERGWSQDYLASLVEASQGAVSRWLSGGQVPSDIHRIRLRRLCGIPLHQWTVAVDGGAS